MATTPPPNYSNSPSHPPDPRTPSYGLILTVPESEENTGGRSVHPLVSSSDRGRRRRGAPRRVRWGIGSGVPCIRGGGGTSTACAHASQETSSRDAADRVCRSSDSRDAEEVQGRVASAGTCWSRGSGASPAGGAPGGDAVEQFWGINHAPTRIRPRLTSPNSTQPHPLIAPGPAPTRLPWRSFLPSSKTGTTQPTGPCTLPAGTDHSTGRHHRPDDPAAGRPRRRVLRHRRTTGMPIAAQEDQAPAAGDSSASAVPTPGVSRAWLAVRAARPGSCWGSPA